MTIWLVAVSAVCAQAQGPAERFTTIAAQRADPTFRVSVEIDIDRWSDESEGNRLAAALRQRGIDGVFQALKLLPSVGQIRSITGMKRTVRYARETRFLSGARQFLLLVDPFTSHDLFQSDGAKLGDLSAVSIWLGPKGEGEGQISTGNDIGIDPFGTITVDVREPLIVFPTVSPASR